jgi:sugar/nucleoside kinase (ribokinase family)
MDRHGLAGVRQRAEMMETRPPRVLVCGDIVNDILVETSAPLVYGDDNPAAIEARPGGSAANQAVWMARCGLDVIFAGRAGADDAEFHRRELARFGVEPWLAADQSAATGSIVVLVGRDGERTMITDRGANLRLRVADVPAALLEGAALLHLTGYTFFHPEPRGVALMLIAEAARRGIPFTVDPGSAAFLEALEPGAFPEALKPGAFPEAPKPGAFPEALEPGTFLDWTRGAAICLPNRDEAAVLTGESEPAAMAAALARHYGAVALKLGADGALRAAGDGPPVRIPAKPAAVRDTTGAGDAFCAGLLAAWLTGSDLAAAAHAATNVAAMAVSAIGGRPAT